MKTDLASFFKKVVHALKEKGVEYALAGGLAASIYRANERMTKDLDFLILAERDTEKKAASIIKGLGLESHVIRKADLEHGPMFAIKRRNTVPLIIAGRPAEGKSGTGLDFILPEMPWSASAVERAKSNRLDFGFGPVPCITREDVIISKFYALKNDRTRFNDLDDLKSIFQSGHDFDAAYVCGQMHALKLLLPSELKGIAPKSLMLTSRRLARGMKGHAV